MLFYSNIFIHLKHNNTIIVLFLEIKINLAFITPSSIVIRPEHFERLNHFESEGCFYPRQAKVLNKGFTTSFGRQKSGTKDLSQPSEYKSSEQKFRHCQSQAKIRNKSFDISFGRQKSETMTSPTPSVGKMQEKVLPAVDLLCFNSNQIF